MLDIKFIRENSKLVKENNINRNIKVDIDKLLELDEKRKVILNNIDEMRAKRNAVSKVKPTEDEIKEMKQVGIDIKG